MQDISLYIFDKNFNLIAIIEEWISLIWKSVFNDGLGGVDLELPLSADNISVFQQDHYICRSDKIDWQPYDKSQGCPSMTYFNDMMVIEAVEIRLDEDKKMRLTVGGTQILTLLNRRVNIAQFNINDVEPVGFWERLSRGLIRDTVRSNMIVDKRRGLPVDDLCSYNKSHLAIEEDGSIRVCEAYGFLSLPQSRVPFVNARYVHGYAVSGNSYVGGLPDVLTNITVFVAPNAYMLPKFNILKTSDGQFYIAANLPVKTNASTNTWTSATYLPLRQAPPISYGDVHEQTFSSSQMTSYQITWADYESRGFAYPRLVCDFIYHPDTEFGDVLPDPAVESSFLLIRRFQLSDDHPYELCLYIENNNGQSVGISLLELSWTEEFEKAMPVSCDNLLKIINDTCVSLDIGLSLYPREDIRTTKPSLSSPFCFAIYNGEERHVEFSVSNDNLIIFRFTSDNQSYANVAYIRASYPANPADTDNIKEVELTTYTPQDAAEDIERREIYISSDADYQDAETKTILQINTFRDILVAEGNDTLAADDHSIQLDWECEIVANGTLFEFNKDYFLGDIVSIKIDPVGTFSARIIETTESWDSSGARVQIKLKSIKAVIPDNALCTEAFDSIITEDNNYITT